MAAKVIEKWYLVTDPLGWTHRVCIDNKGTWGHENIMHFTEVIGAERKVLLDKFMWHMLNSSDDKGEFLDVKWVKEAEYVYERA